MKAAVYNTFNGAIEFKADRMPLGYYQGRLPGEIQQWMDENHSKSTRQFVVVLYPL